MEVNAIYEGDNLEIMSKFSDKSIDLIYADPPFFSNHQYEVIWEDGAEIRAFQDRWLGGIEHYISWMEPRLKECWRLLKDTGSMYLHCDWHANAHLRIAMEKIFGENNFRSEIIWQRTSSHNDPKNFGNIADYILYFVKSKKFLWNPSYVPFSQEYTDKWYRNVDSDGRRYMSSDLASPHPRPNLTYEYKGFKPPRNGWKVSPEIMKRLDAEGRLIFPKNKEGIIRRKVYLDTGKGQPLQNLWSDIRPIHSQSTERLGYPTQKPVALLERIINVSSNKGDLILDPFCGCGTALVASQKLGRKWIGIDVSPTACKLMVKRLKKEFSINPMLVKGEVDMNYVRKLPPFEFQNWVVVDKFFGTVSQRKSGDMGIDGYTPPITGGYPIQVKQSESVGRNVIDNFQPALDRAKKKKGYIVAFSFVRGAYEEAARVKNERKYDIVLRTVQELLDGKVEE